MKNSFLSCENRVAIIVSLDVMLAKRKMRSKELAEQVGITEQNLSLLKNGKVKGVRLETLDKICRILDCQRRSAGGSRTAKSKIPAHSEVR